jgi:hypothetical protein
MRVPKKLDAASYPACREPRERQPPTMSEMTPVMKKAAAIQLADEHGAEPGTERRRYRCPNVKSPD